MELPLAPKPKGLHKKARSAPYRPTKVKVTLSTPLVPLHQAQDAALKLRASHPMLDDDTVALCILTVTTRLSTRAIARELGAQHTWCYARLVRPDVQAFLQQLASTTLGVAASRSISTLEDLRDHSKDEHTRMKAATELLDRAGMGNTSSHRAAGISQSYVFSFAPAPAKADG